MWDPMNPAPPVTRTRLPATWYVNFHLRQTIDCCDVLLSPAINVFAWSRLCQWATSHTCGLTFIVRGSGYERGEEVVAIA
jgi:hypothetical protein